MDIVNKNEVRFLPVVRPVFGFPRSRGMMSFLKFHRHSLWPDRFETPCQQGASTVDSSRRSMFRTQRLRSQRNELGPQGIDCGLDDFRDTGDRQHFVKELVQARHRWVDQTTQHLALAV